MRIVHFRRRERLRPERLRRAVYIYWMDTASSRFRAEVKIRTLVLPSHEFVCGQWRWYIVEDALCTSSSQEIEYREFTDTSRFGKWYLSTTAAVWQKKSHNRKMVLCYLCWLADLKSPVPTTGYAFSTSVNPCGRLMHFKAQAITSLCNQFEKECM